MKPGTQRAQLDATLRDAYAEGLLSADTFAARVGELLGTGPVHPERVIGDVTLRGGRTPRSHPADRLARLTRWPASVWARRGAPLLALDWTGATESLLVGRDEHCDVLLDDATVSRRHAQLAFRDGAWVLKDLGSTNGTSINGVPVGRSQLRPGDLVAFAGQRFRVD